MRFFGSEKQQTSPTSSLDNEQYAQNYPGTNGYDQEYATDRDSDLDVSCPSHTTERKLVTRIDWHVIPFLCILYLLAFLDRVNIANANVYGLAKELGLKSIEYNTALGKTQLCTTIRNVVLTLFSHILRAVRFVRDSFEHM